MVDKHDIENVVSYIVKEVVKEMVDIKENEQTKKYSYIFNQ